MYAITFDNPIAFNPSMVSIYTSSELSSDPTSSPSATSGATNENQSWWQRNRRRIRNILVSIVSVGLGVLTMGKSITLKMMKVAAQTAITGAVIFGAFGGLLSLHRGNCFFEGLTNGLIDGALNGFILGILIFSVTFAIKTAPIKAGLAKAKRRLTNKFNRGLFIGEVVMSALFETMDAVHNANVHQSFFEVLRAPFVGAGIGAISSITGRIFDKSRILIKAGVGAALGIVIEKGRNIMNGCSSVGNIIIAAIEESVGIFLDLGQSLALSTIQMMLRRGK